MWGNIYSWQRQVYYNILELIDGEFIPTLCYIKDDKILTLSTCYNDYGMRLVVQAKLIKQVKKS